MSRPPVHRQPSDRRVLEIAGVRVTILLSTADTGGRYSIVEYVSPPTGLGPPLHYHRELDETFHIMEGQFNFQIGDQRLVAGPGTVVHVPPGVPHAFWNSGPGHARFLGTIAPGGFEGYFLDLKNLMDQHPQHAADIRPLVKMLDGKYDQVIVGPPPGAAGR